jgi:hypothetical protein
MNTETRETLILAAISAFDLCGNMSNAVYDAASGVGLPRKQVEPQLGGILIEANKRIRASVRP